MSEIPTFNPLKYGITGQPLMVPKHEYNKLVGSQDAKIREVKEYYWKCRRAYGPRPTPYQSGVLLGLEIAYGCLVPRGEEIGFDPDEWSHSAGATPTQKPELPPGAYHNKDGVPCMDAPVFVDHSDSRIAAKIVCTALFGPSPSVNCGKCGDAGRIFAGLWDGLDGGGFMYDPCPDCNPNQKERIYEQS